MAISISMVPLGPKPKISPKAIKADLEATWPDIGTIGSSEKSDNSISFSVGNSQVVLGLMPAPIPWSELEGPCATSVLWPNSADVLRDHKSHLIVTVMMEDDANPIEQSTRLTQVTSSVVHTCNEALGIYWGNATLVIQPELFRNFAVEVMPEAPPIYIWIDFRIGPNEQGTTSGFTHGMRALGHMELETENATDPPAELRERFEGLIMYLLENGPVIQDGDTIGQDANERITANYSESSFGHSDKVMRLDFASTGKRKGWFGR